MLEHSIDATPNADHGYCTDDVARALVVVLREPGRSSLLRRLELTCLDFLEHAQRPDGRFHNRLSAPPELQWLDDVGSDDANGRALWAIGTAAACATEPSRRERALACFDAGASFRSPSPRANAYAVLGAAELLAANADHGGARALIEAGIQRLGHIGADADWPWPEARLAYDNARLAEAWIAAGAALGDQSLVESGLLLLDWLVRTETHGESHFSFTPVGGRGPRDRKPAFDQQPIEAGAMADACSRAFAVTGDQRWAAACLRAAAWFVGVNDAGVLLLDPVSGGCRDGLGAGGCNGNEGAESTIVMIAALQQARGLQAAATRAASTSLLATVAAPTQRSAAPYVR